MFMPKSDYDLTLRTPAGSRRYQCADVFNILDDSGRPARSERRSANLVEESTTAPGGTPGVRWTYSEFGLAVDGEPSHDADALPPSGAISFAGVPEDEESYVPPVESFGLSTSSPTAWMTAELVLHTRAFAIVATRTHGGIDRLRRLGDAVTMPWSGREERVVFGAMLDATLHRGESTLRFDGVTVRHGRGAAFLTCFSPYDLSAAGLGPAHIEVISHLWLDLETGELLAGEARQSNYIASVPRPDGSAGPMNHRFETSVELDEAEA